MNAGMSSRRCGPATLSPWTILVRTRASRAIRSAGAHLSFLPKYSPDLNPARAVIRHLRKAAKRTTEAVYKAIGPILDIISSAECTNYFVNAGYLISSRSSLSDRTRGMSFTALAVRQKAVSGCATNASNSMRESSANRSSEAGLDDLTTERFKDLIENQERCAIFS